MSVNNDARIKELMEKVATQRKELGSKPAIALKTNGIFNYEENKYRWSPSGISGNGAFFNINTVNDPFVLVHAMAHMLSKKQFFHEAAIELELNTQQVQFAFGNYLISEWKEDFKNRLSILQWQSKKDQLDKLETQLADLVSKEAKTEMELDKISKLLG